MTLLTEKKIESIEMPENLAVSMMVMKQRMECEMRGCDFNIVHYAFGGSPFPVPDAVQKRLAESTALGHYGAAEGMEPLRAIDTARAVIGRLSGIDVAAPALTAAVDAELPDRG